MLIPKRTKYRKPHRVSYEGKAKGNTELTQGPMRVLKGKKLPGHMGHETITIQNLMIVDVDVENKYILVSGNVPGAKNSFVFIKEAIKGSKYDKGVELVSYDETEIVEDSPVEEVVLNETSETTEEVKETEEVSE